MVLRMSTVLKVPGGVYAACCIGLPVAGPRSLISSKEETPENRQTVQCACALARERLVSLVAKPHGFTDTILIPYGQFAVCSSQLLNCEKLTLPTNSVELTG